VDGELHGAISGLEQRFATHPLYRYYLQTGDGEAQKLSQVMTRAQAARYRQNDPFPQQLNARFQMGVFFSAGAATVSTLIFVRAFRDFTAHERDLLNRLYPHLVQAFRNTASLKRICHDLDSVVEMLEGPTSSVVVLAGDGQVKRWTEQARTWIAQYCRTAFPAERNRLPECFNEWYRRQRSLIARETLLPAARDPLTVDKNGRQLTVQLIPDDFRDEHLLLLNEKAHDASWASLADCGLTPRESEVLAWVAKGKTNAEVGTILQLSGRTVQKHLEHIYDKLGVETRTTATVRALTVIGLHG
jgi:DNA-binding CsgD family transcriptional regulator